MENIMHKLNQIEQMLQNHFTFSKSVLNVKETAQYLHISESHLYKLTSTGVLPFYKPNGKRIYFSKSELDTWLLTNKHLSESDLEERLNNLKLGTSN
jgi:excisionase family DNA binding protein